MDYREYFRGKKITVMGLGLLGRGIGDVRFLAECGAQLIVTDLKTAEQLRPSLAKLKKFPHLTFRFGEHRLEDFRERDLIIKAAGVPLDSPFIAEARKNGIPVAMSTALFAQLSGAQIIGITGTRGKSTTTHLIYHLLKQAGRRVYLGGNVRGVSTLAMLKKVKPGDWVVLELDSWQLQGFGEAEISPAIAVFTNLFPDHLNYYKGDLERYFADKANIYKYQRPTDLVVAGKAVAGRIKSSARKIVPPPLPESWRFTLPGKHNRVNAGLAVAVARELGLPESVIRKAAATFPGIPGRLELVRIVRGVKFYNDTTSTTPDALRAGLEALGEGRKNIVLIMGGADKNLLMNKALQAVKKYCKAVVLLPGTGTDKLPERFVRSTYRVTDLKEGVSTASALAERGDLVLFSPGFASFGLFKNEFDRGDQFNKLVNKL